LKTKEIPYLTKVLKDVEEEVKMLRINKLEMDKFKKEAEDEKNKLPKEVCDKGGERAVHSYTRYIWGNKSKVKDKIKNGLLMNLSHPDIHGWNYLHVGEEKWIAILYKDYGRDGTVCEVEIKNLPEGYFYIEDPDLSVKKVDSGIIVSKNKFIPSYCLTISSVQRTKDIVKKYPAIDSDEYWQFS
jgi:hypothetical protein